jgi:hypothetical protein
MSRTKGSSDAKPRKRRAMTAAERAQRASSKAAEKAAAAAKARAAGAIARQSFFTGMGAGAAAQSGGAAAGRSGAGADGTGEQGADEDDEEMAEAEEAAEEADPEEADCGDQGFGGAGERRERRPADVEAELDDDAQLDEAEDKVSAMGVWDASYKEAKHLGRYHGESVFKALITTTNEVGVLSSLPLSPSRPLALSPSLSLSPAHPLARSPSRPSSLAIAWQVGEIRVQFHVVTDGHDQMIAPINALLATMNAYGQEPPELLGTDKPAEDKGFFQTGRGGAYCRHRCEIGSVA